MTIQEKIIGRHPASGLYNEWTVCEDTTCSTVKRHRKLLAIEAEREQAVEQIAKWIVKHHLSEGKKNLLLRKKEILKKYDFAEYANSLHVFPKTDKTKKGNLGEIILIEYLSQTAQIPILVYRLRFNPNVDQSMKGDDVLLLNEERIIVGESKYRTTPSKQAVEAAVKTMRYTPVLPLSLGFVADRLYEQGEIDLSVKISEIQLELGKKDMDIKNVSLLLSAPNIGEYVEKYMDAENKDFLVVSLGIEDPVDFMRLVFDRANDLLSEGDVYEY